MDSIIGIYCKSIKLFWVTVEIETSHAEAHLGASLGDQPVGKMFHLCEVIGICYLPTVKMTCMPSFSARFALERILAMALPLSVKACGLSTASSPIFRRWKRACR